MKKGNCAKALRLSTTGARGGEKEGKIQSYFRVIQKKRKGGVGFS